MSATTEEDLLAKNVELAKKIERMEKEHKEVGSNLKINLLTFGVGG